MTKGKYATETTPIRLYNLDVFEYEHNSVFPLYGTIPFISSLSSTGKSTGVFWLNAADSQVDLEKTDIGTPGAPGPAHSISTHFVSEAGLLDFFVVGEVPSLGLLIHHYSLLTGFPALPPLFATGYHQCRWNYESEHDVAVTLEKLDEADVPVDVMWLDIEHTDSKKYFTWDKKNFPTPINMQEKLAASGRKLVTIIDPHIKADSGYPVYKEGKDKDMLIKREGGAVFEGNCWPGNSAYPDFLSSKVREWWGSFYTPERYNGLSPILFVWNDMNEPTVFNAPEVSLPKECMHLDGRQHREVHNIYGLSYVMATHLGQEKKSAVDRPFTLTRSFFSGVQRYAAIWTGDSQAKWEHLRVVVPMILSLSVAGAPFTGSDVGGFFYHPSAELSLRWFQVAAFQPFFRQHAHHDSPRREIFTYGLPHSTHMKDSVQWRYRLLLHIYTLFFRASITADSINKALFMAFPNDIESVHEGVKAQSFLLGNSIAVYPVLNENQQDIEIYLPRITLPQRFASESEIKAFEEQKKKNGESYPTGLWYSLLNNNVFANTLTPPPSAPPSPAPPSPDALADAPVLAPGHHKLRTTLAGIPAFLRGGTVLPLWNRHRKSSFHQLEDPVTLVVAPDQKSQATGDAFIDDGRSHAWSAINQYHYRRFTYGAASPSSTTHFVLRNLGSDVAALLEEFLTGSSSSSSSSSSQPPASASSTSSSSSSSTLHYFLNQSLPLASVDVEGTRKRLLGLLNTYLQQGSKPTSVTSSLFSFFKTSSSSSASSSGPFAFSSSAASQNASATFFYPAVFPSTSIVASTRAQPPASTLRFSSSVPTVLHPTFESICNNARVDVVQLLGQPKKPKLASFYRVGLAAGTGLGGEDNAGLGFNAANNNKNGQDAIKAGVKLNVRVEYDEYLKKVLLVLPEDAKVVDDWEVEILY